MFGGGKSRGSDLQAPPRRGPPNLGSSPVRGWLARIAPRGHRAVDFRAARTRKPLKPNRWAALAPTGGQTGLISKAAKATADTEGRHGSEASKVESVSPRGTIPGRNALAVSTLRRPPRL